MEQHNWQRLSGVLCDRRINLKTNGKVYKTIVRPGAKTIKKNTNSTQNKFQTHRAKQYEVTSFLSTDCELSTETCSKNVYSLGPSSDVRGCQMGSKESARES